MKGCELCSGEAWMYCESDEARLCWECDARVHGANFLVARHSRLLLCRSCRSPTAWNASGPRLTPTVSLCDRCSQGDMANRTQDDDEEELEKGEEEEEEEAEEEAEEEEEEEHGEYQVVPWSSTTPPPPPYLPSSSSSEDSSSRRRMHDTPNLVSQRDLACSSSSSQPIGFGSAPGDEATSFGSSPLASASAQATAKKKPQHNVLDIRNLRDISAVDLVRSSPRRPPV